MKKIKIVRFKYKSFFYVIPAEAGIHTIKEIIIIKKKF